MTFLNQGLIQIFWNSINYVYIDLMLAKNVNIIENLQNKFNMLGLKYSSPR